MTADGARARFFTLERPEQPELEGGPNLIEQLDLVNPEHVARPIERFANVRSGLTSSKFGPSHAFDDHRERNLEQSEARFAKRVAARISEVLERRPTRRLVLCADPRMLGMLRAELSNALPAATEVRDLAKDFSGLTPPEVHRHLADAGVVPARERPPERPARRL